MLPSQAYLTPHEAEPDLVKGFTSAEHQHHQHGKVDLCIRASPVEGLQGLRATCRQLIVQTGGVQTVPDIQQEETINNESISHSFIKTKN